MSTQATAVRINDAQDNEPLLLSPYRLGDLERSARFYEATLAPLGLARLVTRPGTVGFGKRYPEFWINLRSEMLPVAPESGSCVAASRTFTSSVLAVFGVRINVAFWVRPGVIFQGSMGIAPAMSYDALVVGVKLSHSKLESV